MGAVDCSRSGEKCGVAPSDMRESVQISTRRRMEAAVSGQVSRFHCPHCSATLRIRDRMYVGRQVECPDCHGPITIVSDGAKRLTAHKSVPDTARNPAASDGSAPHPAPASSRRAKRATRPDTTSTATSADLSSLTEKRRLSALLSALKSPVGVAWSVAGVTTLIVAIAVLSTGQTTDKQTDSNLPTASQDGQTQNSDHPSGTPPSATNPAAADKPAEILAFRLKEIGRKLDNHRKRHGHYPRGTVPTDKLPPIRRLSWMARLLEESSGPKAPRLWSDKPWDDPLNEEFVRRRMVLFQNPLVEQLVGEHGYPATHFVGMAGVGADAPALPTGHPRAGVFGYDRQTRQKDITDGVANTILIVGVNNQLGSWAAGGRASIRPLTRAPYVNGPDGFGTGRKDGMSVLMADGSVRFLSANTDPRIVRRMAAMADGLDLDLKVPGEPGDRRTPTGPPGEATAGPANPRPMPREPVIAPKPQGPPEPVPIDVAARLQQPILRFEQSQAVPVRDLLSQVEEMSGVPIRFAQPAGKDLQRMLDRQISLKLVKTTVGGILKAVLDRAGLSYRIETGGIRIGNRRPERTDHNDTKSTKNQKQ